MKFTCFVLTHDQATAARHSPWAVAFVQISGGYWCFADKAEADAFQRDRHHGLGTRPGLAKGGRAPWPVTAEESTQ